MDSQGRLPTGPDTDEDGNHSSARGGTALRSALRIETRHGAASALAETFLDAESQADALDDLEEAHSHARLGLWRWTIGARTPFWSPEMYRIVGHDPAAFEPTMESILQFVHPKDRDEVANRLARATETGEPQEGELRIVRPDGSRRFCWTKLRPIVERGKVTVMRGILLDITERREAELALKASEEHHRSTLELNPQIPWTADPEGNILEAGARWQELVEPNPDGWAARLHPDDRAPTEELWRRCLATGEPLDTTYRLRLREGGYHWFRARARARRNDSGEIVRWYGLLEDIDDQVVAEQALRDNEQWLILAHEAAGIGMFDVDFAQNVSRMSPQSLVLHGLPADAPSLFVGREGWTRLIHPEDGERAWAAIDQAVRRDGRYDFTFRIPLPDGSMRWIQGLGRVRYDAEGQPVGLLGVNMDVTARKEAEARLEQSEALNRSIVEATPDSIKLMTVDGLILFANDGSENALEVEGGLVGRSWLELWPSGASQRARYALAAARAGGVGRFSAARATAEGNLRWWDVVVSPVRGENGGPQQLVSIARDITQQKTAEDRVHWSATHDALTHLPNRRLFEERLAEAIDEAEVSGQCVGLLALDLDRFKQVNDTLGHDAGNAILRTLADRLRVSIRPTDMAARLGGDEFAVIVPNIEDQEALALVAERILDALREPVVHGVHTLDCRASIGASIYPHDGQRVTDLLKHADLALYSSKASHNGGLLMFQPHMRAELQQRLSMIRLARDALGDDRLCPFYQPKVNLVTGAVIGFEALARWEDNSGNMHPPASIAAAFEDYDVATAITERMLHQVASDMRAWLERGIDFCHVAINASAPDFRRGGFAERMLEALAAAGVPARYAQLEVTETVFLGRGADYVEKALKLLSGEGVTIALDDFGTGYASLSHLKQFPVDLIKIDRSFVADLSEECGEAAIVEAVVNLGRSLKIEVVAEGVETEAQATRLRRMGCKYGQGFLYSPAVAAHEIPGMAKRRFRRAPAKPMRQAS